MEEREESKLPHEPPCAHCPTVFEPDFAPGDFDEDAAHRLRSRRQKMGTVFPRRLVITAERQSGFMHERGGL